MTDHVCPRWCGCEACWERVLVSMAELEREEQQQAPPPLFEPVWYADEERDG